MFGARAHELDAKVWPRDQLWWSGDKSLVQGLTFG